MNLSKSDFLFLLYSFWVLIGSFDEIFLFSALHESSFQWYCTSLIAALKPGFFSQDYLREKEIQFHKNDMELKQQYEQHMEDARRRVMQKPVIKQSQFEQELNTKQVFFMLHYKLSVEVGGWCVFFLIKSKPCNLLKGEVTI